MIGELAGMETGVGTPQAFQVAAANHASTDRVMSALRALHPDGVTFTPYQEGHFQGVRLHIEPHTDTNLTALGIYLLAGLDSGQHPDLFANSGTEKLEMFYKAYGSAVIRDQVTHGMPPARIVAGWNAGVSRFESARQPYLLY